MTEAEVEQTQPTLKIEREFVVPGDKIVSSMEYLPGKNSFRDGDAIYSKRLGMVHVENHVISVVPLSGGYTPQIGDMVIGEIDDIQSSGWFVDLQSPHSAYLSLSGINGFIRQGTDLSTVYNAGELIYVKIVSVNKQGVGLSMFDERSGKLTGGRIVHVEPVKIPRVIGKQGSMISLIKRKTGSNIVVGQNGLVWLQGGDEALATTVIKMVEKDSHIEGLTDKVEKYLEENAPKGLVVEKTNTDSEYSQPMKPASSEQETDNFNDKESEQ